MEILGGEGSEDGVFKPALFSFSFSLFLSASFQIDWGLGFQVFERSSVMCVERESVERDRGEGRRGESERDFDLERRQKIAVTAWRTRNEIIG